MINGLTRLTSEAREVLKDLRHKKYVKTKKLLSLKVIGSFLIKEASNNPDIMKKFMQL